MFPDGSRDAPPRKSPRDRTAADFEVSESFFCAAGAAIAATGCSTFVSGLVICAGVAGNFCLDSDATGGAAGECPVEESPGNGSGFRTSVFPADGGGIGAEESARIDRGVGDRGMDFSGNGKESALRSEIPAPDSGCGLVETGGCDGDAVCCVERGTLGVASVAVAREFGETTTGVCGNDCSTAESDDDRVDADAPGVGAGVSGGTGDGTSMPGIGSLTGVSPDAAGDPGPAAGAGVGVGPLGVSGPGAAADGCEVAAGAGCGGAVIGAGFSPDGIGTFKDSAGFAGA